MAPGFAGGNDPIIVGQGTEQPILDHAMKDEDDKAQSSSI